MSESDFLDFLAASLAYSIVGTFASAFIGACIYAVWWMTGPPSDYEERHPRQPHAWKCPCPNPDCAYGS